MAEHAFQALPRASLRGAFGPGRLRTNRLCLDRFRVRERLFVSWLAEGTPLVGSRNGHLDDPIDYPFCRHPFHYQSALVHSVLGNYVAELLQGELRKRVPQGRLAVSDNLHRIEHGWRAAVFAALRGGILSRLGSYADICRLAVGRCRTNGIV